MSSKYGGYMGKVMAVDLTTETVTEYPWSDNERELYNIIKRRYYGYKKELEKVIRQANGCPYIG